MTNFINEVFVYSAILLSIVSLAVLIYFGFDN